MTDLFTHEGGDADTGDPRTDPLAWAPHDAPLADRVRPRTLAEFEGQTKLVGEGKVLRRALDDGASQSLVLWGPPGVGKTTLARLVAAATGARFEPFSAVMSGVKEARAVMLEAEQRRRREGTRTLLFVDEIHRFNKAQQDAFLPFVERGDVLLVGATTENPSFEVNAALLSRCRVLRLEPLEPPEVVRVLRRAIEHPRGLAGRLSIDDQQLLRVAHAADGDARRALTLLESVAGLALVGGVVDDAVLAGALEGKAVRYDKSGEEHYDLISALHKSVRNSDADAALYWLARMFEGGEDRRYLARRLVRIAIEDIGIADPFALRVALDGAEAYERLGTPEGELALAQAAVYLARAPKSNAVYVGLAAAVRDVHATSADPVPLHLRNAPTALMKAEGFGRGYRYAHDDPAAAQEMECLPPALRGRRYLGSGGRSQPSPGASDLRSGPRSSPKG
ncbi:MAG: replication-associated recombination protein A [Planctomycetota bacterium]